MSRSPDKSLNKFHKNFGSYGPIGILNLFLELWPIAISAIFRGKQMLGHNVL